MIENPTEVQFGHLSHRGSSIGYVADPSPEWSRGILQIGGPLQTMWDEMHSEMLQSALIFGKYGDYWLAVRPDRVISDGRPMTEIRCWLSADPISALQSCFPEVESIESESSSVGFHTAHDELSVISGKNPLSDSIQCWAMRPDPRRSQTGISCNSHISVSRGIVSSSSWITNNSGNETSDAIGSPDQNDPLFKFRRSSPILSRARALHSMEGLSNSIGEQLPNLLFLHEEGLGSPRYSSFLQSDRIRLLLKLGERNGAFNELLAAPSAPDALPAWREIVPGSLPFTSDELRNLYESLGPGVWNYISQVIGGTCSGADRASVIQLMSDVGLEEEELPYFLSLCPDYMSGTPESSEVESMRSISAWEGVNTSEDIMRICRLANSHQPKPSGSEYIESRATNMARMMETEEIREVKLSELLSSEELFRLISTDRTRVRPFMDLGVVRLVDRSRWVNGLSSTEFLKIYETKEEPEHSVLTELSYSGEGLGGLGESWPLPRAIPSRGEISRIEDTHRNDGTMGSEDLGRLALWARLLNRPGLTERIAFGKPALMASISMLMAVLGMASLSLALGDLNPLQDQLSSVLPELSLPSFEGPLGDHIHIALGIPSFLISLAFSFMAFRSSRRSRSLSRESFLRLTEGV